MRLRRASTVVCYWRDSQLVLENYLTRRSVTADPVATLLLTLFDDWTSPREFFLAVPSSRVEEVRRTVRQLIRYTFLLRQGSTEAKRDAAFANAWQSWLPHAGFFHFGSKDVRFLSSDRETRAMMRRFLAEGPQPAFFKSYRKLPRVQLPKADVSRAHAVAFREHADGDANGGSARSAAELFRVLLARRTQREFSLEPLSVEDLAQLLYYTWGVTGYLRVPLLGALPLKTSPSGGARHPGEVYVLALRVRGLRPGLYHYLSREHALERIRAGRVDDCAVRYCAGQKFVGHAAALFVMTAVIERSRWKYRMARAYRVLLTEVGHLCQVFYLVATALSLASFCTMALSDSAIEQDLGLDGINELPLYVAGVGLPPSR